MPAVIQATWEAGDGGSGMQGQSLSLDSMRPNLKNKAKDLEKTCT